MRDDFEWDEPKRLSNIAKHKIDFIAAFRVFDGRLLATLSSDRLAEVRFVTVALVYDVFLTVVWAPREERRRIISLRRSRDAEKRYYRQLHQR